MRMTEKNITKTLGDYKSIVDKAMNVVKEMGSPFYSSIENTVLIIKQEGILTIRNACNLEEFDIPISYLLDKEGEHMDEYSDKLKKDKEAERISLSIYNKL